MSEGSQHFEENSAVFKALHNIASRLKALGIPYAVIGGMALFRHGFRRFSEDVNILVTLKEMCFFQKIFLACIAGITANAVSLADRPATVPVHWIEARKQLREPSDVKSKNRAAEVHRLIFKTLETEVSEGSKLRFFCGIERIRDFDQRLLNPFTETSFPKNMIIAIYDEDGHFLHSVPSNDDRPIDIDDPYRVSLIPGEMRGRVVEISISSAPDNGSSFFASLKPGTYKFQLIACRRFYMGDEIEHARSEWDKNRWRIEATLEGARSDIQVIRITKGPPAPPDVQVHDDDPKLLAVLELKNRAEEMAENGQSKPHFVFTLTNLSRSRSIGLIAPFSQPPSELPCPIRWSFSKVGSWKFDIKARALGGGAGQPQRSDFVILPPQGMVSHRFGGVPTERGEYEMKVELHDGIVIDADKLEILRTGDPKVGWRLGGVAPDVIHADSVLERKFTVK